jgi:hypothetical protein
MSRDGWHFFLTDRGGADRTWLQCHWPLYDWWLCCLKAPGNDLSDEAEHKVVRLIRLQQADILFCQLMYFKHLTNR